MNIQYLILVIIIILLLFFILMGLGRTIKIFVGNYISGFLALLSYLFIDFMIHYIDSGQNVNIKNPDALLGLIMNNKTIIVILIYFTSFILFYKSKLSNINLEGFFSKMLGYIFLPIITSINIMFTILLIINGVKILTYDGYNEIINSFNITNPIISKFFYFMPIVIVIFPIIVMFLLTNIKINISFKKKQKKQIENNDQTITAEN